MFLNIILCGLRIDLGLVFGLVVLLLFGEVGEVNYAKKEANCIEDVLRGSS